MRDRVAQAVVVLVAIVAIGVAAAARTPPPGTRATDAQAHDVYRDLTAHERSLRREAAVAFPGDLWSQDDDFHRRENETVRAMASKRSIRLVDVVRAVDDGMRERWPTSDPPIAPVPPCRPRLSY